jgi:hypothetical protein
MNTEEGEEGCDKEVEQDGADEAETDDAAEPALGLVPPGNPSQLLFFAGCQYMETHSVQAVRAATRLRMGTA